MYSLGWIGLVLASLWISVIAFVWAARSGQFSDQSRARYLALGEDISPTAPAAATRRRPESYALLVVTLLGAAAMIVVIGLSLLAAKGTG
jgi:cbb3-type cytochrome oxidase maturation protein